MSKPKNPPKPAAQPAKVAPPPVQTATLQERWNERAVLAMRAAKLHGVLSWLSDAKIEVGFAPATEDATHLQLHLNITAQQGPVPPRAFALLHQVATYKAQAILSEALAILVTQIQDVAREHDEKGKSL